MAQIEYKLHEAISRAKGFLGEHVVDRRRGADGRIPYVPSGWRSLPSALRHIPVSEDDVLQAAERPFKRVIGVELIVADITTWSIPDDVTILYAYNPVRGELFDAAMNAMIASHDRDPRPMYLFYRYPREHDALEASGRFHLLRTVKSRRPRRAWAGATAINVYSARPAHDLQS